MKYKTYIDSIKPYVPGKPIEEVKDELGLSKIIKLASNENPNGVSPRVVRTVQEYTDKMNRYPEDSMFRLKEGLSKRFSVSKKNMSKQNKKLEEEYKLKIQAYRALNENLSYQASHNYDKYIITLSAGALALSLTFISTILKEKDLEALYFLYSSWIFWGIAIISILYSFATASKSHEIAIEQVDSGKIHDEHPGKLYSKLTIALSRIAGCSFLIASLSIVIFVSKNIKKGGKSMPDKKPLTEGTVPKAPPPKMEKKGSVPMKPPPPPPPPPQKKK